MISDIQLARWKALLARPGDVEGVQLRRIAAQLVDEVQALRAEASGGGRQSAAQLSTALERRLADLSASGDDCPACHDAEARVAMARLREIAQGRWEVDAPQVTVGAAAVRRR